jgi:hypothetical protein
MRHTVETSNQTAIPIIGNIVDFLDALGMDTVSCAHDIQLRLAGIVFDDVSETDDVLDLDEVIP